MTTIPPFAPPPGWYPDPAAPEHRQRWWDGNRWTDYAQLIAQPTLLPPLPQPLRQDPTSGIAIRWPYLLLGLVLMAASIGWLISHQHQSSQLRPAPLAKRLATPPAPVVTTPTTLAPDTVITRPPLIIPETAIPPPQLALQQCWQIA